MDTRDTSGPAFPIRGALADYQYAGLSQRDFFAINAPQEEIRELMYQTLSREAQEKLAGMPFPVQPSMTFGGGFPADYYIEKAKFYAAVNAALRFMMADAMLKERA